jgi:hypothetical protein
LRLDLHRVLRLANPVGIFLWFPPNAAASTILDVKEQEEVVLHAAAADAVG